MQLLKHAATAAVVFAALDAVWLGVVMNGFYRSRLASIVRLSPDGAIAPNWPAALVVYVLLGVGVAAFVAPRRENAGDGRSDRCSVRPLRLRRLRLHQLRDARPLSSRGRARRYRVGHRRHGRMRGRRARCPWTRIISRGLPPNAGTGRAQL